jgi:pilus assembly protein CpaF
LKGLITLLASLSHREIGDEKSSKETYKIISAGIFGYRFEAWSKPVSLYGPSLTVRKLPNKPISLEDYADMGTIKFENIQLFKQIVIERKNILIAGATGSGKTTFFNSLVNQIPLHERLLVIETIPEINISKRNALFLQADSEQGYSVNRLIESALRGLPDRILIGELRGKEADGFLTICNTGHPGSIATIHANSSLDVLIRLEDMIIQGRKTQSIDSIRKRISSMQPIIIYL